MFISQIPIGIGAISVYNLNVLIRKELSCMAESEPKKLLILYILNILREHTDPDHPILQQKLRRFWNPNTE